jgi:hypothetical protein
MNYSISRNKRERNSWFLFKEITAENFPHPRHNMDGYPGIWNSKVH